MCPKLTNGILNKSQSQLLQSELTYSDKLRPRMQQMKNQSMLHFLAILLLMILNPELSSGVEYKR